jgi:hypothetical protein
LGQKYILKNGYRKKILAKNRGEKSINYIKIIPDPIKLTFWGGFAVDADFSDAFSGSIEGPFFQKISENR